jgi:hypothetical protein
VTVQPKDVTAYGCDYSAREFTPTELDRYPGVRISWLARYIGYPGNRKCISTYPGAYRAHRDSGRPVVLFHQIEYRDFEGGYASGRTHAQAALTDARSMAVGWDGETPILACFDRRMPAFTRNGVFYPAIPLGTVRDYMRGFVSVLGHDTAGFYGFEDTMRAACAEDWARFRMQCGARSAHIPGITAWQENNEQPLLLGTQTDRLELYIDLSEIGGVMAKDELLKVWIRDPGVPSGRREIEVRLGDAIAALYAQEFHGLEWSMGGAPWPPSNAARIGELSKRLGAVESLLGSVAAPVIDYDQLALALIAAGFRAPTAEETAAAVSARLSADARDGDPNTGPTS